ncbi:MAG: ABC transporter ATP-binding protein [Gemmatimonadota bacterium]|jgi:ABC-2 type transport system ATP-binding protein
MSGARVTPILPVELEAGPMAISIKGLNKRYGSIQALDGLDLDVPEGAIYVLVGPNGAGKTTLLKVLMNLIRSEGGGAALLGLDTRKQGALVRAQVGYVPEDHGVGYEWMGIGRLLEHCSAYYPTWDEGYAEELAAKLEIDLTRRCAQLSKGQARRVQLLLAVAHRPPVLLMDEPTDGLDHLARDGMLEILAEHLTDTPTTALISTHRVYEIEKLVDHVGVIREGRLLVQMPTDLLRSRLRRYSADVPEGWQPDGKDPEGTLIRRPGLGRTVEWTVWGEEERVVAELSGAGARVQGSIPLTVDDAATALLSTGEAS